MPDTDKGAFSQLGSCPPAPGHSLWSSLPFPMALPESHMCLPASPPRGPRQALLRRRSRADLSPVTVISAPGSCSGR